ncbi:Myb/SANT-like domain-containing protein [Dioscorea alata]|uniref:Myb/SANT-like domain-containing protein n=2 Tax=Dioscorea alata TaxID=55571 RepID=A0ACB7UXW4_DIOAL|nr:Myb/SANT-like domain-containing protein [Dioscorea alata]
MLVDGYEIMDSKDWSLKNEYAFIKILHDKVKNNKLQTSTFKKPVWEEINRELCEVTREHYGVGKLKGKFNRLRKKHREFSTLLAHTSVSWDTVSNTVHAPDEVWQEFFMRNRSYKQFRKRGCDYYEILGEIFSSNTSSGKSHHTSAQDPLTSEDQEIEEEFLNTNQHVETWKENNDETNDAEVRIGIVRPFIFDSSIDRPCKSNKIAHNDKLDTSLDLLSSSVSARTEAPKHRIEKQNVQCCEDLYSIDACMDVLDSMEAVPNDLYIKVLKKFTDPDWRRMFIKMPHFRRKYWVENLD